MPFRRTSLWGQAAALLAVVLFSAALATSAFGAPATPAPGLAPHVPVEEETDVCAMCHRAHTSVSSVTWSSADESRSALLVTSADRDSELCYTCHGVEALGAGTDVQSSFEASSGHSIEPSSSEFGAPKSCGTCHDSHGAARASTGTPFPGLLRVATGVDDPVYQGDAICTACHVVRPDSRFPGPSTWAQSPHARIEPSTSGTQIVCVACHDQHGSSVAPSLRTRLETPSAPATAVVEANDRTMCFACHEAALGTFAGASSYPGSAHASATATVPIVGEWADDDEVRLSGECQVCHAPMGAADASGTIVPNLLEVDGRALCDRCHRADGPAASNVASLAFSPTTPGNELIAAWVPAVDASYGRAQVWSREATAAGIPTGPRELTPVSEPGHMVTIDIDSDGLNEAILADLANPRLAILEHDPLRSVVAPLYSIAGIQPARLLSAGDVFIDGSGLPEIVTVTANGEVRVSRLSGSSLVSLATATLAHQPLAVACGDVTGTVAADIVVTTKQDEFVIITENGTGLQVLGPYPTLADPVAVAVGNLDDDATFDEIAIGNQGEAQNIVSLFTGDGVAYSHGGIVGAEPPTAILIGDVLEGVTPANTSGAEIAVAYTRNQGGGASGVYVIEQAPNSGIDIFQTYPEAAQNKALGLSLGDVDGDGDDDLAVALGGAFNQDATSVAPTVSVYSPDAAGLTIAKDFSLSAGGTEAAGREAWVAIADLGPVVTSRHPASAVPGAHTSTETVPAVRHVECVDCHNTHEAKSDASDTVLMPGELIGAWGISRDELGAASPERAPATAEYEVCYSCHSAADPTSVRDIASEVITTGASFHPIEGPSPDTNATGSVLTSAALDGATITCGACHGTSIAGAAQGPHRSATAPLLVRRYLGTPVTSAQLLCYECHNDGVYLTGDDEAIAGTYSGFYNSAGASAAQRKLHSYHASSGVTCAACHESHGVPGRKALLRGDAFTFSPTAGGGECTSVCHTTPATVYTYVR